MQIAEKSMGLNEVIESLLDQAQDRDSFIDKADPECIFRHDGAALREAVELLKKAYGPNEPLTLDELRQMDGEPVWVQYGDGRQGWAVVENFDEDVFLYGPQFGEQVMLPEGFINMEYDDSAGRFGLHVLGWRAYRRRPEEVQK